MCFDNKFVDKKALKTGVHNKKIKNQVVYLTKAPFLLPPNLI